MRSRAYRLGTMALAIAVGTLPSAASAADDDLEFWFNPTVTVALDADTSVKLETAQRLRRESQGRPDTFFFRLWAKQQITDQIELAGAIERRINDGRSDETRTMQQLSVKQGILRGRVRLEERFIGGDGGRLGLRLRTRIGAAIPLVERGRLTLNPDIETFLTLRDSSASGDLGKRELRAQIALGYKASKNLTVKAGYLIQYDLEEGARNTVGRAPILGLNFLF